MTDLPTLVAQAMAVHLWGSSWRGLSPTAQAVSLGEARRLLADIEPLILDEAVSRVRLVLPPAPTCVQPCSCDGCRMAERIEQAVRGIE